MPARDLIKHFAAVHGWFGRAPSPGAVTVLTYHRVTGDLEMELDLPTATFEWQMNWLSEHATVVPYRQAVESLLAGNADRPWRVALTFDDAYADFYTHALPVLKRLELPATLFVPTGFIDEPEKLPLSRNTPGAGDRMRPLTWDQLGKLAVEPLISLGSHTHDHPDLDQLETGQIRDQMARCSQRFAEELGQVPVDFAYPRGAWNERVADAVADFCETAAIVGGAVATPGNTSRFAIPRVPVRRSDGVRWFPQRVVGAMGLEEKLANLARRALGRSGGY